MGILKKAIAVFVLLMMMNFSFAKLHFALADQLPAQKGKITEHEPQGRTTVEIDSPKKSGRNWLWALLGVAAIGGIAAAAGGDGGGGSSHNTGSFESSW